MKQLTQAERALRLRLFLSVTGLLCLFHSSADATLPSSPTTYTARVCGLVSTLEGDGTRGAFNVAQARAVLQAVNDVNSANCTILGSGCERRVRWPGGRLRIDFSLWEQDRSARSTPAALLRCVEAGNEIIIGPSTTPQTESALLLANVYEVPVIGYTSTSTLFSSQEGVYANFARSIPSDVVKVEALVSFLHFMQWKQITILYKSDAYGYAAEESLVLHARRFNISAEAISLGTDEATTDEVIAESLKLLEDFGRKVVVLILNPMDVVRTLLAADTRGMNTSSYVWTSLAEYFSAYEAIGSVLPPTDAKRLWRLLGGLISPMFPLPARGSELKEHVVSSQPLDALNDYIRNITGSEVTIPISERVLQESNDWFEGVPFTGNAYDAVWLVAEAWAKAQQAYETTKSGPSVPKMGLPNDTVADSGSSVDDRPSNRDVMREITSPGNIEFYGVTGNCSWNEKGDRMAVDQLVLFTNLPIDTSPGLRISDTIVGHYRALNGVVLDEGRQITWADGTTYPTIPSDGSPPVTNEPEQPTSNAQWDSAAIAVGVVAAVVLPLLAYLVMRIRTIKKIVGRIVDESSRSLDLESPLSKMLNLLERIGSGDRRKRPTAAEANELRLLVATHSHNLAVPVCLMRQLKGSSREFTQDIANYLVGVTAEGGQNNGQELHRQQRRVSSFHNMDIIDLDVRRTPSIQYLQNDIRKYNMDGQLTSNLVVSTVPSYSLTPGSVYFAIGRDPFLDLITSKSIIRREAPSPLEAIVRHAAVLFNLESILGTQEEVHRLMRFTVAIEAGYKDGGYHCKLHAADVTNRMAAIMHMAGIGTRRTRLAALVASVLHDYEHPQVNNQFLVATESEMALAYNDQAVAENHSLRSAMQLMRNEAFNFTASLCTAERRGTEYHEFRANVIQLVLGTEMSRHFEIVSRFNVKVVGNSEIMELDRGQSRWHAMDDATQLLTLQVALKVADIGHCALPWDQHFAWLQLLQEEMFAQGDKEREAGIEVSPLMDREKPGVCVPASQIGFLDIFVFPLLTAFVKVFPECQQLLDQVNMNYKLWQEKAANSAKNVDGTEEV